MVRASLADGINDIGEEFQTIFGDIVIGEGSKEDTWYKSNPSEYYKNTFNDNTKPSARSNTGANSLIKIYDFSEIDSRMSLRIAFGSDKVNQISTADISSPLDDVKWINTVSGQVNKILMFADNTGFLTSDYQLQNLNKIEAEIDFAPASFEFNNAAGYIFSYNNQISYYSFNNSVRTLRTFTDSVKITTPPVISKVGEKVEFMLGNESGFINVYEILPDVSGTINNYKLFSAFSDAVKQVAVSDDNVAAIGSSAYWDNKYGKIEFASEPKKLLMTKYENDFSSVILLSDNTIEVIKKGAITASINIDQPVKDISFADLKADGSNYIIVNTGSTIDSYNLAGGKADNFPVEISGDSEFVGCPLAVDLNTDNYDDVVAFASDGRMFAYSGKSGEILQPFPLSIGNSPVTDALLFNNSNQTNLLVVGSDLTANLWQLFDTELAINWASKFGTGLNSASIPGASSENVVTTFFPKSKAYNWPNPVYDDETYFRFYVAEDAKVEINIFDLAGDMVTKLNKNVQGGYDNEITWNVSGIQSGVYFAHLNIEGTTGKSDYKIIKVAVIK